MNGGGGTAVKDVVGVLSGIVMLAVIAVLVSGKSNTASVIGASSSGFAQALTAAEGR